MPTERQRVLPVVTLRSTVHQHVTPAVLSTTTRDANKGVAMTTRAPPGEPATSRVLPPVNISDLLSPDQLRQHTERIYQRVMSVHTDTVAANMPVHAVAGLGSKGAELVHEGTKPVHKGVEPAHEKVESANVGVEPVNKGMASAHEGTEQDCKGAGLAHERVKLVHKVTGLVHEGVEPVHEGVESASESMEPVRKRMKTTHDAHDDSAQMKVESAHEGAVLVDKGVESVREGAESVTAPVLEEAEPSCADSGGDTAVEVNESDCDNAGDHKMSADVSASVDSDGVDRVTDSGAA